MTAVRIGTRGSALALWQARTVSALLEARGARTDIIAIRTGGDRLQDAPLSETGGKRLFVKEIEDALLGGGVDVAVHSAKDMSAILPDGLAIAAVLPREDPRDALVLRAGCAACDFGGALEALGARPAIGTGSIRRIAQLAALLPHARFAAIRGNVDTRLKKLDGGAFDALVLAAAGLRRLGRADRISAPIPVETCVPAPGQGIVAIEIRADDERTREAVAPFDNAEAAAALTAERAVVTALGGGCQLPLGAIAVRENGRLVMQGVVASPDGRRILRFGAFGALSDPAACGRQLADGLIRAGALEILDRLQIGDWRLG